MPQSSLTSLSKPSQVDLLNIVGNFTVEAFKTFLEDSGQQEFDQHSRHYCSLAAFATNLGYNVLSIWIIDDDRDCKTSWISFMFNPTLDSIGTKRMLPPWTYMYQLAAINEPYGKMVSRIRLLEILEEVHAQCE